MLQELRWAELNKGVILMTFNCWGAGLIGPKPQAPWLSSQNQGAGSRGASCLETLNAINLPARSPLVASQEFLAMAQACSTEKDTVHYMHSMNWIRDVKGASHLDYILFIEDSHRKEVGMEG